MKKNLTQTKQNEIKHQWHLVDVKGKIVGRVATDIALKLRGKHKPNFVSHLDCGDFVVAINAKEISVSGSKEGKKVYTHYSGYPGGQKTETLGELRIRKPEEILRNAVSGMLPKNKLRKLWLSRLYIYPGDTYPYTDKFVTK